MTRPEHGPEDRYWEQGWEGHERAQRRRLAALPLSEKLQWLEEAHRLVLHMSAARASGGELTPPAGGGDARS